MNLHNIQRHRSQLYNSPAVALPVRLVSSSGLRKFLGLRRKEADDDERAVGQSEPLLRLPCKSSDWSKVLEIH